MRPTLYFLPRAAESEIVKLGDVMVGEVGRYSNGAPAHFIVWLPEERHGFRPAANLHEARVAVVRAVQRWLARIGVAYPGESIDIDAPADPDLEAV